MSKADNLPPSCAVVTKSGNLNLLETPGSVHVCNGTALPLPFTKYDEGDMGWANSTLGKDERRVQYCVRQT